MIVYPLFDTIILPDTYIVLGEKEYAESIDELPKEGESIIFVIMRSYQSKSELTSDNFYPIGLRGHFEKRQDSFLIFKTEDRLELTDIAIRDTKICLGIRSIPDEENDTTNEQIGSEHYAGNILRFWEERDIPTIHISPKLMI